MKAVETEYKGYKFRSRLEARWAVFFDACGVKWEYEPEGYQLDNGMYYLPDFLLHDVNFYSLRNGKTYKINLYIEVKGELRQEDIRKIRYFCKYSFENPIAKNPIIIVGNIPVSTDIHSFNDFIYDEYAKSKHEFFNSQYIDGENCNVAFIFDEHGRFSLIYREYSEFIEGAYEEYSILPKYQKAFQARFEYGENPLQEQKKKKRKRLRPTENQTYCLRQHGYKVKDIKKMTCAEAYYIINSIKEKEKGGI